MIRDWHLYLPTAPANSYVIREEAAKYLSELKVHGALEDPTNFNRHMKEIDRKILDVLPQESELIQPKKPKIRIDKASSSSKTELFPHQVISPDMKVANHDALHKIQSVRESIQDNLRARGIVDRPRYPEPLTNNDPMQAYFHHLHREIDLEVDGKVQTSEHDVGCDSSETLTDESTSGSEFDDDSDSSVSEDCEDEDVKESIISKAPIDEIIQSSIDPLPSMQAIGAIPVNIVDKVVSGAQVIDQPTQSTETTLIDEQSAILDCASKANLVTPPSISDRFLSPLSSGEKERVEEIEILSAINITNSVDPPGNVSASSSKVRISNTIATEAVNRPDCNDIPIPSRPNTRENQARAIPFDNRDTQIRLDSSSNRSANNLLESNSLTRLHERTRYIGDHFAFAGARGNAESISLPDIPIGIDRPRRFGALQRMDLSSLSFEDGGYQNGGMIARSRYLGMKENIAELDSIDLPGMSNIYVQPVAPLSQPNRRRFEGAVVDLSNKLTSASNIDKSALRPSRGAASQPSEGIGATVNLSSLTFEKLKDLTGHY